MVRQVERTTEFVRLQQSFEVISLPQNRKFQDFVENKYMADDSIGNAETDGNQPKHLSFKYSFDTDGGATGAIIINSESGTPQLIPQNAIITNATIEIETAITSGGSATVAFGLLGNTDAFKAATGKASLTLDAVFAGTNELPLKVAVPTQVVATVATAALTAGVFFINVEYIEGN